MANEITLSEIEHYVNVIIPKIELELSDDNLDNVEKLELYDLYTNILKIVARYDFISYNKYLELDDDHNSPNKAFYHHRKDHMGEVFQSFNDMEIYDKYDILIIKLPPRTGKTTTGIRFLSWIIGRHPECTQLATSYSDNITSSFYIGVMEIVEGTRYQEIFGDDGLVISKNAKRQEIWLKVARRYPSITFVPVGGSMTGRCEAELYLYCDDMVSGLEEALSVPRLNKLWGLYSVNCIQRKKDGCKEIHLATPWSVHDIISKVEDNNRDNPRCKIVHIPCYDENGESNFDFYGGFSTKYYNDIQAGMDEASFSALYKGEPIEREGILYNEEDLQYYFDLPQEPTDSVIAVCDSKNMGRDYVSAPIGKVYGDLIYIDDVVFNNGLPDITRPLVANKLISHNVIRADVEMNNGGNYYAEELQKLVKQGGGNTSIRTFYTSNNKTVKIITYADFVKKHFVFKHPSLYSPNSEYGEFMKSIRTWSQTGKNPHDDGVDSISMLAELFQNLTKQTIKFIRRSEVNI